MSIQSRVLLISGIAALLVSNAAGQAPSTHVEAAVGPGLHVTGGFERTSPAWGSTASLGVLHDVSQMASIGLEVSAWRPDLAEPEGRANVLLTARVRIGGRESPVTARGALGLALARVRAPLGPDLELLAQRRGLGGAIGVGVEMLRAQRWRVFVAGDVWMQRLKLSAVKPLVQWLAIPRIGLSYGL